MSQERDPQDNKKRMASQRPPDPPVAPENRDIHPAGELSDEQLDQARGGALNAYLKLKDQKQGDITGTQK